MDKSELKKIGKDFLSGFTQDDFEKLDGWIQSFELIGRTPKGQKKAKESLAFLARQCEVAKMNPVFLEGSVSNVNATFSWWDENKIDEIVEAFAQKSKVTEITIDNITVRNESAISEAKFKKSAQQMAKYLNSFSGFHSQSLEGDVTIVIKKASDLNSKAKYQSEDDSILVKSTLKFEDRTLPWALAHEMGHRHERLHGLPEGFYEDFFRTTQYSFTESLSGSSEAFAEIYVLSLKPASYPKYKEQLTKFGKLIKEPSTEYELTM